jgi:hypothetical protein
VFDDILKKLKRSKDLLLQSANLAHFEESQEARIFAAKKFQVLVDDQRRRERLEIMELLSAKQDFGMLHRELQDIRSMLPQTTRWIYKESEMINWIDGKETIFWLCGLPGAGMSCP